MELGVKCAGTKACVVSRSSSFIPVAFIRVVISAYCYFHGERSLLESQTRCHTSSWGVVKGKNDCLCIRSNKIRARCLVRTIYSYILASGDCRTVGKERDLPTEIHIGLDNNCFCIRGWNPSIQSKNMNNSRNIYSSRWSRWNCIWIICTVIWVGQILSSNSVARDNFRCPITASGRSFSCHCKSRCNAENSS